MKISVIIPVYNSEKYLSACIDSVLGQTHQDVECILINDESTDHSLDICMGYAQKDNRVIVINQKNAGTSAARNAGMKAATGDYIMFLDNDDYWDDSTALKEISSHLEESDADILMFNTKSYYERTGKMTIKSGRCSRQDIIGQPPGDALKIILEQGLIHRAVWAKAVKRTLILEYGIMFPEGMRNEDTIWTAKAFAYAKSYDWSEKVFYVYRKQTGTAQTDQPLNQSQLDDLKAILIESIELGNEIKDRNLQKSYYSYLAFPFSVWLGYSMSSGISFKELRMMKKRAFVLKYNYDKAVKSLSKLYSLCGYYITAIALKVWVSQKR
ncbi:glycosyltransferase [Faecalicatena orotica]|uniref:Glycosyl transferase family 2 n=1 Tax=Faecalicatena orotica TaxID=1544 RepID=A0A2Y9BKV7_9FIRM|nr:glycosyltransferase [Faecalicatena orotica]PWJ19454.1 glycosyl transferase family 2 [Faecalicatena orotica]SSA58667.1 Glycosyl transferase family 2 [Faecalicatena orotica]